MEKEFGLWFWIHILLLIPAYLSPIFFDWKLIVIGVAILQIQYWIVGGCILTHLEMGKDKNETFIWYYLKKFTSEISPQKNKVYYSSHCTDRPYNYRILITDSI